MKGQNCPFYRPFDQISSPDALFSTFCPKRYCLETLCHMFLNLINANKK